LKDEVDMMENSNPEHKFHLSLWFQQLNASPEKLTILNKKKSVEKKNRIYLSEQDQISFAILLTS